MRGVMPLSAPISRVGVNPQGGARSVVAVDPGNSYTGIACAWSRSPNDEPVVERFTGVVMIDGQVERSVAERLFPLVAQLSSASCGSMGTVLAFEEPPEYSRSDVGHGSEARIGYAEGWLSGLIAGSVGLPTRRVAVSAWRDHMLVFAARRGLLLAKPTRAAAPIGPAKFQRFEVRSNEPPLRGFTRVWLGCAGGTNHEESFVSLAALTASTASSCPVCATSALTLEAAGWVRDEWKRMACEAAERFWPRQYAEALAPALERARLPKPAHQLGGVADGCEALWIALYALSVRS